MSLGDGDVGDVVLGEGEGGVEHDPEVPRKPVQGVGDHHVELCAWASSSSWRNTGRSAEDSSQAERPSSS